MQSIINCFFFGGWEQFKTIKTTWFVTKSKINKQQRLKGGEPYVYMYQHN